MRRPPVRVHAALLEALVVEGAIVYLFAVCAAKNIRITRARAKFARTRRAARDSQARSNTVRCCFSVLRNSTMYILIHSASSIAMA